MLGSDAVCTIKFSSVTMDTIKSELRTNIFIPSRLTISYNVVFSSGDASTIRGLLNKAVTDGTFVSQLNYRGGYVVSSIKGNFQISSATTEPTPSPVTAVTIVDNGSGSIPKGKKNVILY